MYIDVYFQEMKKVLNKIETTQKSKIEECAKVIAQRLVNGGAWHIQDTGHMLIHECIDRSGGLVCIKPIEINVNVTDKVRSREGDGVNGFFNIYASPELAKLVVSASKLHEGDVLVVGSTSGYSLFPVELALEAKKRGVITIAVTTIEYSKQLQSKHPSGLRLFEACDYFLDNCSNFGDAIVHLDEVDKDMGPGSGIGASYVMWALQIGVAEELIKMGKDPAILRSIHAPNGDKILREAFEQYEKLGY